MKKRLAPLDLLRLVSVLLVMYAHFVSVGTFAPEIPSIIKPGVLLPLAESTAWRFWLFDSFLIEVFSTQAGILGVSMFFMITGYLMPTMLERYSRVEFLMNRAWRIFPVLVTGTLLIGLFLWLGQGIIFPVSSYLASWTLTYSLLHLPPVAGVLWTLIVEVLFYFVACMTGRFTVYKLLMLQTALIVIILLSATYPAYPLLLLAASQAKYLLMILVGSAIYLAEREAGWGRQIALVCSAIMLSYVGFKLFKIGHEDTSTYANLSTMLLAAGLFVGFQALSSVGWLNRIPAVVMWLSDLVYPVYIVHAAIGLATMAMVRSLTPNPYVMLAAAVMMTLLVSTMLHYCVERPGISLGRKFVRKIANRASVRRAAAEVGT